MTQENNVDKPETKKSVKREAVEWILTFVIPIVVALLLHNFVFTFSIVKQTSMLETLHEGEWLAVSRIHYTFVDPARGDIVMSNYEGHGDKIFVKRMIGLPGETIEIRNGQVYIDGRAIEEDYIIYPSLDQYGPLLLGENEYFLMGDNRYGSMDSRMLGTVTRDDLYGFVMARVFPFTQIRSFYQ